MRKQFTFYASFFEAIQELPDGQREQVYDAVCAFALKGETRELSAIAQRVALKLIMPNLISSRAKALAAQRKTEDLKTSGMNKRENEKENENEIEKEIEKEIEIEKEVEAEGEDKSPEAAAYERACLQRDFDIFWEAYPIKLDRQGAWLAWLEQKPQADAVMQALERWKISPVWQNEGGRFIPQARKFLAQGYAAQSPPQPNAPRAADGSPIPRGALGEMGDAEREAIRLAMLDG